MDLKILIDEVMSNLLENGADTYLQCKLMIKANAAESKNKAVIHLWDVIFAETDNKKPLLLEMH